jgi:hypothetical protein
MRLHGFVPRVMPLTGSDLEELYTLYPLNSVVTALSPASDWMVLAWGYSGSGFWTMWAYSGLVSRWKNWMTFRATIW